jgi:UDP-glucose 4-epimerase
MNILVTGGAGYIGSHACVELLNQGYSPIVLDNLANSSRDSLKRVEKICGQQVMFVEGDIRNRKTIRDIFLKYEIEAVMHFAGLKSVGESVTQPLTYYENNVSGSVILFQVMAEFSCKTLVFSSSATVYGNPETVPICEDFPVGSTTNPYGASKFIVEEILRDLALSDPEWSISLLRYFNPVGAHESGLIGESPSGAPNNLMPFISQVALGVRPILSVFGNDYPTPDGTGVRDYIHVTDLVSGHIKALEFLNKHRGVITANLGTGYGVSVLEMIDAFEKVSGSSVSYKIVDRRPGDVASCFADASFAESKLGWRAERSLIQMCEDSWRWQVNNPRGYD